MSRHFLAYWNWKDNNLDQMAGDISHAGSDQFQRVSPGDWLWFVTVPPDDEGRSSGSLILLGRMRVAEIVTVDEARRRLGTDDIWQHASWHALADPDSVAPEQRIDITHLASSLRFQSDKDKLNLVDGRVNPQQLQSLRLLTAASAAVLDELWGEQDSYSQPLAFTEDDLAFPEGAVLLRQHLTRERQPRLVQLAKEIFKEDHGQLYCQACGFDFSLVYGPLGDGYIEAHHTIPVSQLQPDAVTRIEDLAMVCANCHRMLHHRRPWLTMEQLRQIVSRPYAQKRGGP